jgi:redox-sensitive bicupin YhaK (pirin superfamily)
VKNLKMTALWQKDWITARLIKAIVVTFEESLDEPMLVKRFGAGIAAKSTGRLDTGCGPSMPTENRNKNMIYILRANASQANTQGAFKLHRIRPGSILGPDADPAFGPLSVIDHANLDVGTVVGLHEHKNDEILSYIWRGSMVHLDAARGRIPISAKRPMLMNAGRSFWHEESTPYVPVEMLQIFIRPIEADLPGSVQFFERANGLVPGGWQLIAGPEGAGAALLIRQQVKVYDALLSKGEELSVPTASGMAPWLYVMDGTITIDDERLETGDAAAIVDGNLPVIRVEREATTLLAFLVDLDAPASTAGTISGR